MAPPNAPKSTPEGQPISGNAPVEGSRATPAEKRDAEKADVTSATRTHLESERRIDTTNNILGILETFCKDGNLGAAKESVEGKVIAEKKEPVGGIENGLKAGDIVYMQGLWISVTEKSSGTAKEKQFSVLSGGTPSASFSHLFDLLESQHFFPTDESARAEKLKELETAKKDPFAAAQKSFLALLQTVASRSNIDRSKLPDFFAAMSKAFLKISDASKYTTAEAFSEAVGGSLGKPFEDFFGKTESDKKFFQETFAGAGGLKSTLEAAYISTAQPKEIGDVIANALGSVSLSDFFMKFLEQLMDVLNSGSLMMGASNHFMDEKLKEPRAVDSALAGLNNPISSDPEKQFSPYKPGEQIAFACEALGLPKDYGNFQGNDALEKFYRHLTEDRKLPADVREMTKKENGKDFLERLQVGDLLFGIDTDLKGRGTYMKCVVQVKKIAGTVITVKYLPESPEEGKTDVSPKEGLLSDVSMGSLYASVRPPALRVPDAANAPAVAAPSVPAPKTVPATAPSQSAT